MAGRTVKSEKPKTRKLVKKKTETPELISEPKKSSTSTKRNLSTKQKVLVAGGVLLAAFLIYSGKDLFIAATVNGYPVSRLEVVRELEKQGGQQVLEGIINEKIILQEARNANLTASSDEINAKIDQFKGQLSAQGQDYNTVLETQGISEAEFKKQVEVQVYLEKILADRISVNEEEIASFMETNKDFLPAEMSDEEKRTLAMEELKQQKLSTEFSTWLTEVKGNAKVNYFVEY